MTSIEYENEATNYKQQQDELQTAVSKVIEKFTSVNDNIAVISTGLSESEDSLLNSTMAGQNQKISEVIGRTISEIKTALSEANSAIGEKITELRRLAATEREAERIREAERRAASEGVPDSGSGDTIIDV